jgi:hypothetical protein
MGENAKAFIAITGNVLIIGQDLVRRVIKIDIDARCEHPELREFAGDFLADIRHQRGELLTAVLTIWRFGRQAKLARPKGTRPLGGFERWAAWTRDPLLALGCADPVARITELKASDPKRLAKAEVFQTWWEHHSNDWITANDLNEAVKALLVPDPKKRNRQAVESRVRKLDGTRLAGFHLCSNKHGKKGRWTAVSYWLEQVEDESQQTTDATPGNEARPDAADDPDDWQFNREGDDAARPAGVRPDEAAADAGGIPAFVTKTQQAELRGFGCTEEFILHALPAEAHAFLAQRRKLAGVLTAWFATIGLGRPRTVEQVFADAEMAGTSDGEASDELQRALAAVTNGADNMPLEQWLHENSGIGVGQLVLRETGTDKDGRPQWTLELRVEPAVPPLDVGGWQFNREPTAPEASSDAIGARGFSEERVTKPPLPTDPVKRWRQCFARLDPARDPCAGFRTGGWPRVHNVISTFLASPFAKQAADAGWTDRELFDVHPEVGVARPNACGALMTNAYGSPVTQVTPQLIRFANGLAAYKARLSIGNSVAVWNHRETAANECATCRIGSPP